MAALLALLPLALSPVSPQGEPTDAEALRAQRLEEGWRLQDSTWIPPDEVAKLDQGLWKCGDAWLTLTEANAYHAELDQWWSIPGEKTVLHTTLAREVAEKALAGIEDAYVDLVRLFGAEPARAPEVLVLNSREQFLAFTGGKLEEFQPGKSYGFGQLLHGAYFADNWFGADGLPLARGVAYWAVGDDKDAYFGPLWTRHALGQAFVERFDPSPEALEKLAELRADEKEVGFEWAQVFWEDKAIPQWFRTGAAAYVERYYVDRTVTDEGDPLWARRWSVQNIQNKGGFDGVERVLEGGLRLDQVEASQKWINQCGLLVAFVLDGENKNVTKAHAKLVTALGKFAAKPDKKNRKGLEKAFKGLGKALDKESKALEAFAGL